MRLARGDVAGVVRERAALEAQRKRHAADVQVGGHPLGGLEALHAAVSRDRAVEDSLRGQWRPPEATRGRCPGSPSSPRASRSARLPASMFHCCWKPRIANTISSSASGIRDSVSSPSRLSGSGGESKPSLSRENQAGAATAAKMIRITDSARRDRQHAAVPAARVEREQQVHQDVEDGHRLGALELLPAADRDHGQDAGGQQQQEGDDRPGLLRLRLFPVGVLPPRLRSSPRPPLQGGV